MAVSTNNQKQATATGTSSRETALMIEGLYNGIAADLQKVKKDILNEMKYSSMQSASVYESIQKENSETVSAVKAGNESTYSEINALFDDMKNDLARVNQELKEKLDSVGALNGENTNATTMEVKYLYKQIQTVFEQLSAILTGEVMDKLDSIDEKTELLTKIDEALTLISDKLSQYKDVDFEAVAETVKEKVVAALPVPEEVDYDRIADSVAEKTESCVSSHGKEILDTIACLPVPENVDYTRIVEEVSDKVCEKLSELLTERKAEEPVKEEKAASFDFGELPCAVAEKVVESLPYPDKVDYRRIENAVSALVNENKQEEIDYEKLADAVVSKMPEIDYDKLAETVVSKMPVPKDPEPIDYDLLAAKVAEKLADTPAYDVVVDEVGTETIANRIVEQLDYNAIAEKMPTPNYDLYIAEEDANMLADVVVEKLQEMNLVQPAEEPVEEPVEETVEEEPETVVEIAPTEVDEQGDEYVDADSGLVVRLKKSFEAKLRQSDDSVKENYSTVKNAFCSYKRLNSNVSWQGDRFNYGRDTVAKMVINGKTLRLYIALDPKDEETFKPTVYHQKDVSNQKAYEKTPFLLKIKSEVAAKRAVRLVEALAEKLGAEKDATYSPTDYKKAYPNRTNKTLIEKGLIKLTKEKKTVFDFN